MRTMHPSDFSIIKNDYHVSISFHEGQRYPFFIEEPAYTHEAILHSICADNEYTLAKMFKNEIGIFRELYNNPSLFCQISSILCDALQKNFYLDTIPKPVLDILFSNNLSKNAAFCLLESLPVYLVTQTNNLCRDICPPYVIFYTKEIAISEYPQKQIIDFVKKALINHLHFLLLLDKTKYNATVKRIQKYSSFSKYVTIPIDSKECISIEKMSVSQILAMPELVLRDTLSALH